jgi:sulfur-carrier protein adenylyltransferase/sulfurtransferase
MTAELFDARYARQVVLKGFGANGQARLSRARVLIVGVGGLGSPAASYLAAAGVGQLTLVDQDVVDVSNLHRQLLFTTPDVGRSKLEVAGERIQAINPNVRVVTVSGRLTTANAAALVTDHDIALDATDNFPTRYALNDACLAAGIPFVYGSVARFEGQASVFAAPDGPCYRCLFPTAPAPGSVPTCADEGVLGVVPGVIGLLQATEVIKWVTGIGTPLVGQLLMLDLLEQASQRITLARRADCEGCGDAVRLHRSATAVPHMTPDMPAEPVTFLSPREVAAQLNSASPPTIIDVRERWEYDIAHLEPSVLIPLSTLPSAVDTLDRAQRYALLCHHGMRSEMAANWLAQQGFAALINIEGGIDAWSVDVDPTVPRY